MFTDDQLLPISALQHFNYCPRRAALIHVEGLWAENRFTAEGNVLHRRTHDAAKSESRPGVRIARSLEIRSYHLGLCGRADVVEFQTDCAGRLTILPVEYKRGRPKPELDQPFRIQLCAQALCLEEMTGQRITQGALFFGKVKRRVAVTLDEPLRRAMVDTVEHLRRMIDGRGTPPARFAPKCRRCSMLHLCMPKALRPRATAAAYLAALTGGADVCARTATDDKAHHPPTPP